MLHWFKDHPASVGESYWEHFGVATGFGARLVWGGLRCMLHGALPFIYTTAGSDTVRALNAELVAKRDAARAAQGQLLTVDYII